MEPNSSAEPSSPYVPSLDREPTPDEAAGMSWWNGLSEMARAFWLRQSGGITAADAWAEWKRRQAQPAPNAPE
jgi:hypothetical protein